MIRAHAAAVKMLLDGQGLTVYEGGSPRTEPSAQPPYAVLWTDAGTRMRETLCATSDRADMLVTVTSVGGTPEQARWVAERVYAGLLDQTPVIAGRTVSPITNQVTDMIRRDDDVGTSDSASWYYQVDVFRLVSRPA